MTNDLIVDEGALTIAGHKVEQYGDFLIESIDEYLSILDDAKKKGFVDLLLRIQISRYQYYASKYKQPVAKACEQLNAVLTSYFSAVEAADDFRFPSEFEDLVSRVLGNIF